MCAIINSCAPIQCTEITRARARTSANACAFNNNTFQAVLRLLGSTRSMGARVRVRVRATKYRDQLIWRGARRVLSVVISVDRFSRECVCALPGRTVDVVVYLDFGGHLCVCVCASFFCTPFASIHWRTRPHPSDVPNGLCIHHAYTYHHHHRSIILVLVCARHTLRSRSINGHADG